MIVVSLDAHRQHTIGGSEAAAACGIDPWQSRVALWLEKRGQYLTPMNEAMEWGKLLEPVVFHALADAGWSVMPAPADGFQDDSKPWLVGHPDGFAEIDGEPALLEIKTTGAWNAGDWRSESKAPLQHLVQIHHYFELTGYELALLAVLIGGQRLETRLVHRDDTVIRRMLDLERDFLEYLRKDVMPSPVGDESSRQALLAMFKPAPGTVVRADQTIERHVTEARILRESIKVRKEQLARHEQEIQAFMGEATELVSRHDTTLAKWTPYDRKTLDGTALRKDRPTIASEYTTTKTLRRFTLE